MARRLLALLVLFVALAAAPAARGAPMMTDFTTLRANTALVVLGTVHQSPLSVTIDKVVRGRAPLGAMSVKESPDGHVYLDGQRVVAFIDQNGALRWVGKLIAGASLETGVIQLQGFFDFNAHIVRPGVVTLAQLQTLLATGQLDEIFDATLAFRDGHGGVARSTRTLTIEHAPLTSTLHVTGAIPTCLSPNSLFGLEWGSLQLLFTDACRTNHASPNYRRLKLLGTFTGVDPATGHLRVDLVPERPMLTEAEYATFAADGNITDMKTVLAVALSDRTTWTWRLDDELVDPSGKTRAPDGTSISAQMQNGTTTHRDEYDFGDDVTIILTHASGSGGSASGILTLVESKTPLGCVFAQSGRPDRTCTLAVRPPLVVRR